MKHCEDLLGRIVARWKVYQRHQNAEEAKDVSNEDDNFDSGKRSAYKDVDEDTQEQYTPEEKRAVPAFADIRVVEIVQTDKLQDQIGYKVTYGGKSCYPADDSEPT